MKLCSVEINARCAKYTDKYFAWTGKIEYGSTLIDFLNQMHEIDKDIVKEYYDISKERMKPYHLLFVDDQMLRIDQYKKYLIMSDVKIKVIPFVSGG